MGVSKWWGNSYAEYKMQHSEIFDKFNSTRAFEEDVQMVGFGLANVKTEGASISYDDAMQGFIERYTHIVYALGFIITREMWEDGIAATQSLKKARALKMSITQTIETVAANVLNRAFNSSYKYGDGKELCATDLPYYSGGSWKNELTTAADLSETALEQALLDIADFKTDRGLQIPVRAQRLIVPPELEFEAERILGNKTARPGTANRDINAIIQTGSFPQGYCVNNYLTDADAWFIKTDCPDGMKHYERRGTEFTNDSEFDTENMKAKATFRGSWGCSDKRGIFGSPGAA